MVPRHVRVGICATRCKVKSHVGQLLDPPLKQEIHKVVKVHKRLKVAYDSVTGRRYETLEQ